MLDDPPRHFVPSLRDAHLEILRVLKEEPEDTVTIVAVGPLTNVAMAATLRLMRRAQRAESFTSSDTC